jgi:hypothetical protein
MSEQTAALVSLRRHKRERESQADLKGEERRQGGKEQGNGGQQAAIKHLQCAGEKKRKCVSHLVAVLSLPPRPNRSYRVLIVA